MQDISLSRQMELEKRHVMGTFARLPLQAVAGEGMHVFDSEGRQFLDFVGGIGCVSVGHCRKEVSDALSRQCQRLMHVSNYYHVPRRGEVAARLSCLLGEEAGAWKSFFVNSGAEANECAIKLSRLHSRKKAMQRLGQDAEDAWLATYPHAILTIEGGFHGRSLATLAATAQPAKQRQFEPLPGGFLSTPPNDVPALEDVFKRHGRGICAIVLECIQGESGVRPLNEAFLRKAETLAHEHGALLVVDEVQTGLFRCGAPFAFQIAGIKPDIVTIAKGIADGFPMGVCCARGEAADTFRPGDNGTTFGGGPLAMAAADETLRLLSDPALKTQVESVGRYLRDSLASLPFVEEVRGSGLMVAARLRPGISAKRAVGEALHYGVLLNATDDETLRFLPPLICEKRHVDQLIAAIRAVALQSATR